MKTGTRTLRPLRTVSGCPASGTAHIRAVRPTHRLSPGLSIFPNRNYPHETPSRAPQNLTPTAPGPTARLSCLKNTTCPFCPPPQSVLRPTPAPAPVLSPRPRAPLLSLLTPVHRRAACSVAVVSVSIVNGGACTCAISVFVSFGKHAAGSSALLQLSADPPVLWSRAAVPARTAPTERKGSPSPRPRRHLFPAWFWREPFRRVLGGVASGF